MPQEPISSFDTLLRSIRYDFYAGRWFHYFIRSKGIQKVFHDDRADCLSRYAAYSRMSLFSDALFLGTVVVFSAAFARMSFSWFVGSVLLFLVFQYVGKIQRQRLVFLSSVLLRNEFEPTDFRMMSLFQISEQLSRRYGVSSLVDTISLSDNFLRKLFLAGYVFPWPDVGRSLLVFCVLYFSCKYALNTAIVYERVRKKCRPSKDLQFAG